ncbi:MAG TPA: DUF6209 family protein [Candidatus Saccharimonadales bacterium]|jgi:hypothetical protein|nr:DUF6209 family protein [Candidatus Saccharimonadales bacterium]
MTTATQRVSAGGTIEFQADGRTTQNGLVRQGEQLTIQYDPQRPPICGGFHNGMPAWELFGSARFLPSGELFHGALIQHRAEGSGGRVFDPPVPVPFTVNVPADANLVEMWFVKRDMSGCMAWDSQFGSNYRFEVAQAGPAQPVMFRSGAERSPEMVNIFSETVSKARRSLSGGALGASELETRLSIAAWVQNASYQKNVWIDLHIFDPEDNLASAQTLTLGYSGPAGGNGDFFALDQTVFQGSGGAPGSVWPRPDARRVQYRLYYEVNGRVFNDGILHQQAVGADAAAAPVAATAEAIAA